MFLHIARMSCPADSEATGEGPFVLEVHKPHYCKITDALAGTYICRHERFATKEALQAALDEYPEGYDFYPQVSGPGFDPEPAEPVAEDDPDDCPF